jgi:hypothetical protein
VSNETAVKSSLEAFLTGIRNLGIEVDENSPLKDQIADIYEQILQIEGDIIFLTDDESGNTVAGHLRTDGSVWVDNEQVGFYDAENERVTLGKASSKLEIAGTYKGKTYSEWGAILESPESTTNEKLSAAEAIAFLNTQHNESLALEYERDEGDYEDIWHTIVFRWDRLVFDSKTAFLELIRTVAGEGREDAYGEVVGSSAGLWADRQMERNRQIYSEWIKENPEYTVSNYEYTFSGLTHNAGKVQWYLGFLAANLPSVIGAALAIGTTILTANPIAGTAVGGFFFTPQNIGDVYNDAIASGATDGEARLISNTAGSIISILDFAGEFVHLKTIFPGLAAAFKKNVVKELSKELISELTTKKIIGGAAKTLTTAMLSEMVTESLQTIIQNAAISTVDESRGIWEGVTDSLFTSALLTLPTGGFGAMSQARAQYNQMEAYLDAEVIAKMAAIELEAAKAGFKEAEAKAIASAEVQQEPVSRAKVEIAGEKTKRVVPVNISGVEKAIKAKREDNKGIASDLKLLNDELTACKSSLATQKERLAKNPRDENAREAVTNLEELIKAKEGATANLIEARKKNNETIKKLKAKIELETRKDDVNAKVEGTTANKKRKKAKDVTAATEAPSEGISPEATISQSTDGQPILLTEKEARKLWRSFSIQTKTNFCEEYGLDKNYALSSFSALSNNTRSKKELMEALSAYASRVRESHVDFLANKEHRIDFANIKLDKKLKPKERERLLRILATFPYRTDIFVSEVVIDENIREGATGDYEFTTGVLRIKSAKYINRITLFHELIHSYVYVKAAKGDFSLLNDYAAYLGIDIRLDEVLQTAKEMKGFSATTKAFLKEQGFTDEEIQNASVVSIIAKIEYTVENKKYSGREIIERLVHRFSEYRNGDTLENPVDFAFFSMNYPLSVNKAGVYNVLRSPSESYHKKPSTEEIFLLVKKQKNSLH